MIRRRMRYLDIGERAGMPPRPSTALLPLAVPVLERPEVGIPAAALDLEATADGRHRRTLNDRDDDDVRDHEIVHPDEQCGPLDRIHLVLRRAEELVVLFVPPPRDVPSLELVVLGR